ncbi:family 16 glycoside hydrolase [Candidatus Poribacteria bacterium]
MERSTILLLIAVISCIMASPVSAGTWSDGFEDGNLDEWELAFKDGPTTFRAENGELRMEVHSWSVSMLCVVGSDQWKDYTVRVKVKILKIFGIAVDGGIIIRLNKPRPRNYYYFFIADEWQGSAYPGVPPEGEGAFAFPQINDQAQRGKVKVFTPELDHWYTLKAIAQDKHTEFYLDDELVGEFGYAELRSGSVGLVVSNALVHFDDLVVTGPDIPDGGPGVVSFSVRPKDKLAAVWGKLKQ